MCFFVCLCPFCTSWQDSIVHIGTFLEKVVDLHKDTVLSSEAMSVASTKAEGLHDAGLHIIFGQWYIVL